MSRLPIRVRLTLVFAVVMAVVLAALGAFLYLRLGSSLDEQIADELESRSAAIASVVRPDSAGDIDPSLLAGEEGVARVIGPDVTGMVTLATPTTHVVLLTREELAEARQGSPVSAERDGFRLRADPVDDRVVVVGKALEDRDEALAALLAQLLVALPLALLVSSIIGYLVAGAALRPVEAMRVEADAISASEPDRRLPLPAARDEIYRLGETLNEMLDRLGSAFERERAFVADASHELPHAAGLAQDRARAGDTPAANAGRARARAAVCGTRDRSARPACGGSFSSSRAPIGESSRCSPRA